MDWRRQVNFTPNRWSWKNWIITVFHWVTCVADQRCPTLSNAVQRCPTLSNPVRQETMTKQHMRQSYGNPSMATLREEHLRWTTLSCWRRILALIMCLRSGQSWKIVMVGGRGLAELVLRPGEVWGEWWRTTLSVLCTWRTRCSNGCLSV